MLIEMRAAIEAMWRSGIRLTWVFIWFCEYEMRNSSGNFQLMDLPKVNTGPWVSVAIAAWRVRGPHEDTRLGSRHSWNACKFIDFCLTYDVGYRKRRQWIFTDDACISCFDVIWSIIIHRIFISPVPCSILALTRSLSGLSSSKSRTGFVSNVQKQLERNWTFHREPWWWGCLDDQLKTTIKQNSG